MTHWHSRRLFPLLLPVMLVLLILFADNVQTELALAVERCLTITIPALYAMMILSQLLIQTDCWRKFGSWLSPVSKTLFHLPGECFVLFLLSQITGYPIGASMLSTLVKKGALQKEDARRLLWVCYGCGPSFLVGLTGGYWNRKSVCLLVFGSMLLSHFLLAAFLFRRHPVQLHDSPTEESLSSPSVLLFSSVTSAGALLLRLCGVILCFSAGCAILEGIGTFSLLEQIPAPFSGTILWKSILEITYVSGLSLPASDYLPILTVLLSFGGFCVILQVRTAVGTTFSLKGFVIARGIAAGISGIICAVGTHLFPIVPEEITVSVMSAGTSVQHHGILPVLLLLIMTLLLLSYAGTQTNEARR